MIERTRASHRLGFRVDEGPGLKVYREPGSSIQGVVGLRVYG